MRTILIADEGCWLTKVGFYPEQENMPEFWKEVHTSEPETFTDMIPNYGGHLTDTVREAMEKAWQEAHKEPEPEENEQEV